MSFKKYLENDIQFNLPQPESTINPVVMQPINTPPEGMMMAGPKSIQSNVQQSVWEIYPKEGNQYLVLNENLLKQMLKEKGIIIVDGTVNYEPIYKTIMFKIQDAAGQLNLQQFHDVEKMLIHTQAVLNIKTEPEQARITIVINPEFNLGGIQSNTSPIRLNGIPNS